jgi:hypothetical protein
MPGLRLDSLKSSMSAAAAASGTIGAGANGVVTITAAAAGPAGNYPVSVVNGTGADSALAVALVGGTIVVTLGTDAEEAPDDTKNTATLVRAAIDALSEVSAVHSGNGSTVIAVQSTTLSGGHNALTVGQLAKMANVSDRLIHRLMAGGNCLAPEAARIAAAMNMTTTALGAASL